MWALLLCLTAVVIVLLRSRGSPLPLFDYLGRGVVVIYTRLWHRCSSNGLAPVPAKGSALLVANHTSALDPAILTTCCGRVLSFLFAWEYYYCVPVAVPLLDYMRCVPIRRNGRDISGLRLALRRLREDCILCVFPEGNLVNAHRELPGRGQVGVAWLALRSRAPVFPALIIGGPHTWDVALAWLRPSRARVIFGPAVDLSAYYDRPLNRPLLEEVTDLIMRRIAALAQHQGSGPTRASRGG
jgi:1-acyl-sn-glycerol-3-phosphate acyltransferase